MTTRMKKNLILVFAACAAFIMVIVTIMNIKGDLDSRALLEQSVKEQLISITSAANEIIDKDAFATYQSTEDIENDPHYYQQLSRLRILAQNSGARYIYALKMIDGEAYFVFDTDSVDTEVFVPYELDQIMLNAFAGKTTAGIMNLVDEYGTFNTGAQPIYREGQVIGIVCADIEDHLVAENIKQSRVNIIVTVAVLLVMLVLAGIAFASLLKRISQLHGELEKMAHYDRLTDLPNRRFLMDRLESMTKGRHVKPFALFFIDMDNFKSVNDNAGHDAGDELLRHAADYFKTAHHTSTAYRPDPGGLNVTARIGGDEFILLVPDITTHEAAERFATELLQGFRDNPAVLKFITEYQIGLSIGIALFPGDTDNFHVLIKYADIAMYQAKKGGKNNFCIYRPELGQQEETNP